MKKKAERANVLTENEGKNFIHAVLNAVTKGYADNTIVEDVLELVKSNEISRGILQSAPGALRSYSKSISESLSFIADEVESFEIQDPHEMTVNRKQREKMNDDNVIDKGMKGEEIQEEEEDDKKENNVIFKDEEDSKEEVEEYEADEEDNEKKVSKVASKSGIRIMEDWEKSGYNDKTNKLAGILLINFGQDMNIYKHGNKILMKESGTKFIRDKIFTYLHNEYPKLKANLSSKIFTSNISFMNVKEGKAKLSFEIRNAY